MFYKIGFTVFVIGGAILAYVTMGSPEARACRDRGGQYFVMTGECLKFIGVPT